MSLNNWSTSKYGSTKRAASPKSLICETKRAYASGSSGFSTTTRSAASSPTSAERMRASPNDVSVKPPRTRRAQRIWTRWSAILSLIPKMPVSPSTGVRAIEARTPPVRLGVGLVSQSSSSSGVGVAPPWFAAAMKAKARCCRSVRTSMFPVSQTARGPSSKSIPPLAISIP